MHALLAFHFPIDATYEQVSAAVALHFGGDAVDLSTGEVTKLRDASAVFAGTSQLTVTTGTDAATTPPNAAERDINGLPWDERIHSSSKNKNADGSWRGRKGVPPPTIAKVKAELMSTRPAVDAPTGAQQSMQNDGETARAARIAYAEEQAFITVGPKNCSDAEFDKLKRGQLVNVPTYVAEWFERWQHAMNAAYKAYGENAAAASQTAHMSMQAIAPDSSNTQAVQLSAATETAKDAAAVFAAAPINVNTFGGFATKHAALVASPILAEVLATLGINGFAALATNEVMLPAVNALLATKGIA